MNRLSDRDRRKNRASRRRAPRNESPLVAWIAPFVLVVALVCVIAYIAVR